MQDQVLKQDLIVTMVFWFIAASSPLSHPKCKIFRILLLSKNKAGMGEMTEKRPVTQILCGFQPPLTSFVFT